MNNGMAGSAAPHPLAGGGNHVAGAIAFVVILAAGLGYAAFSIARDINNVGGCT